MKMFKPGNLTSASAGSTPYMTLFMKEGQLLPARMTQNHAFFVKARSELADAGYQSGWSGTVLTPWPGAEELRISPEVGYFANGLLSMPLRNRGEAFGLAPNCIEEIVLRTTLTNRIAEDVDGRSRLSVPKAVYETKDGGCRYENR